MKYGIMKYKTFKYGIYYTSKNIITSYDTYSRVRLKTKSCTYIAVPVLCPNAKRYRVNGTVAESIEIDGLHGMVRVKAASDKEWVITKVVE